MAEPRGREKAGRPRKSAGRKAPAPSGALAEPPTDAGELQGQPARAGSDKEASAAVRAYLDELTQTLPRRGRRRDPARLRRELASIDAKLPTLTALRRLRLVQRRLEYLAELERLERHSPIEELEARFVKFAAGYGERNGISYAAWREFGVPADVLLRAGVSERPPVRRAPLAGKARTRAI